jgi:AraC-like DNA-binding protein
MIAESIAESASGRDGEDRSPPFPAGLLRRGGEASELDPDGLRELLAEYPDAPLIVFLPPDPLTHRPRALETTLARLHGLLDAACAGPASVAEPGHPRGANGGLADWQIRRLEAYIDEHLSGPLHVQDLAAVARLSPGHFAHAFKRAFDEPPLAHVTRRRLARACARMLVGDESLSRIAQECGFCDHSHFTRRFHRTLGMAPQRWRRLNAPGPR